MGCFSFLCKVSDEPAYSTSFDGSPVYMFLLKNGEVIEEMYGNYDSYGHVFDKNGDSFKWKMEWGKVCDLMFDGNPENGIALIKEEYYTGEKPITESEDDPNQGWGYQSEYLSYSDIEFEKVENPYHKIYENY